MAKCPIVHHLAKGTRTAVLKPWSSKCGTRDSNQVEYEAKLGTDLTKKVKTEVALI